MTVEGGFQGRANKLVDSCYSFWLTAAIEVIQLMNSDFTNKTTLFNAKALQAYILIACQNEQFGGISDKPGMKPDFYHTAYPLAGLSNA
jgi:protein farnesyltransferase subunit beta